MKRKLIALLLLGILLLSALPVSATGAWVEVLVEPQQKQIQVGDTVEFVVTASAEDLVAMQFEVLFPEGLRYVPKSGATPKDLAKKLGVPAADWTEISKMFTFYNDVGITMKKGTELIRFTCVAEKAGEYEIELYQLLPFDSEFMEFTPKLHVEKVKVTAKTEQTAPPVEKPTQPEHTAPPVEQPTTPVTEQPTEGTTDVTTKPGDTHSEVIVIPDGTVSSEEPTSAVPDETQAPTVSDETEQTEAITEAPEHTPTEPENAQDANEIPEPGKPSGSAWLIWVIIGAVLTAGAVTLVIVINKRKNK